MRSPLRSIRRRLRSVRYHAASRPDAAWLRWRDRGLLAALLLAIPAVLLFENSVHRDRPLLTIEVGVAGPPAGPMVAALNLEPDGALAWPAAPPRAELLIEVRDRLNGWPITSSVDRRTVTVEINDLRGNGFASARDLAASDPIAAAVVEALTAAASGGAAGGPTSAPGATPDPLPAVTVTALRGIARRWTEAGPPSGPARVERLRFASGAAVVTAWIVLSTLAIIFTSVGAWAAGVAGQLHRVRRRTRSDRLRCASCGFDLRGNLFTERCPECGALAE